MTQPDRPQFTGPDGEQYQYADPSESPSMDGVDSTTIDPPAGAPTEQMVEEPGESTPAPTAPGSLPQTGTF